MAAIDGEATLLLDGVDMEELTECVEGPVVWPYQGFAQRGDFPTAPAVDGGVYINQPYDTAVLPVQVTLRSPACSGGSGQALRVELAALRAACKPDHLLTLRRLWPDSTYEEAAGKFLNITPARPLKNLMSCLVEFTLLGLWYGPSVNIPSGAGAHTIAGTTRTHRMTVTLDGAGPQTITNTTNGYSFTYSGSVPSPIVVDVEARTATLVSGSLDVSMYLEWEKNFPMRLDPGANTLTTTAGTFSVDYQPAYL
jgi:hypothetical protein